MNPDPATRNQTKNNTMKTTTDLDPTTMDLDPITMDLDPTKTNPITMDSETMNPTKTDPTTRDLTDPHQLIQK